MSALKAPELLLPAGGLERMRTAYDFGADAVYAGQPRYSLRARNNEFKLAQIAQGISEAHQRGKKFFLASNLLPHNDKVRTYLRDIEPIIAMQPDGLIMADPGLIMMVLDKMHSGAWNHVPIHLSVQANTVNHAAVKFWQKAGVTRIILSRELSLDEVEAIRNECPDMELEVFVHGALCIAYSGRCYLSGYFNRRDPNQGTCTNACRWGYHTHQAEADSSTGEAVPVPGGCGSHDAAQPVQVLHRMQARPPLEDMGGDDVAWGDDADEGEGGEGDLGTSFIMNSKDLRAVEHVARLVAMGIDSLKVEGRTKSRYYVARTAQVYRRAIDDAVAGRPFNPALLTDLDALANRGYAAGLLEPLPSQHIQNYASGYPASQCGQFVAEVLGSQGHAELGLDSGWVQVETKNRFAVGDALEVLHPGGNTTLRLAQMRDARGQPVDVAQGSPVRVWIPLPAGYAGGMLVRLFEGEA